jgi:hypothetical protein
VKIVETDRQGRIWSAEFTDLESQARAWFDEYFVAGLGLRAAALRALQRMPRAERTAGFVTHLSQGTLALDPETALVVVT